MIRLSSRRSKGRAIALAAAISLTAAGLASCSGGSEPETSMPEVDNFSWNNYEGDTLNVLLSRNPLADMIQGEVASFEKKTGITVNIETLTETDYMVKILSALQSQSGSYDVFMTSAPMNFQYAAAGWIENLQPWVDDPKQTSPEYDFEDFYPALIEANRWNKEPFSGLGEGPLWAIPANEEGYALFYRKDILKKFGIEVPQTIDELIAAAKKLDGKTYQSQTINGFVSRGDKTYPTLNPFSTFAGAYGVQDVTDGEASINTRAGVTALQKWAELMSTGSQAAATYTWYEAQQAFMAGTAAFYIDADHMANAFEGDDSNIAGEVGYALPPKGPEGRASSMWVWSLGMNASSERKGAAWQFIQWATAKDTLTTGLDYGNINPTRTSVADSEAMAEYTSNWGDYNKVWRQILADYAHWQYAPDGTWTEVGDIWATAIQKVVLGQDSAEQALNDAAKEINTIIQ